MNTDGYHGLDHKLEVVAFASCSLYGRGQKQIPPTLILIPTFNIWRPSLLALPK